MDDLRFPVCLCFPFRRIESEPTIPKRKIFLFLNKDYLNLILTVIFFNGIKIFSSRLISIYPSFCTHKGSACTRFYSNSPCRDGIFL